MVTKYLDIFFQKSVLLCQKSFDYLSFGETCEKSDILTVVMFILGFISSTYLNIREKKKHSKEISELLNLLKKSREEVEESRSINYEKMRTMAVDLAKQLKKDKYIPDIILCFDYRGGIIAREITNALCDINNISSYREDTHGLQIPIITGATIGYDKEQDKTIIQNEEILNRISSTMINLCFNNKYTKENWYAGNWQGVYIPYDLCKLCENQNVLIVDDWIRRGGFIKQFRDMVLLKEETLIRHNESVANYNKHVEEYNQLHPEKPKYKKSKFLPETVSEDTSNEFLLNEIKKLQKTKPKDVKLAVLRLEEGEGKFHQNINEYKNFTYFVDTSKDNSFFFPWGKGR